MKRLGIAGKLVLSAVCILTCLATLVTWYSIQQFREILYRETVRRVEAQTLNWIEANITQIALVRDPGTLARLVRELQQREGIGYVILADEKGSPLASAGDTAGVRELGPAQRVEGVRRRISETENARGGRFFELATPISATGTGMSPELEALFRAAAPQSVLGQVRVAFPQSELPQRTAALVAETVTLYGILLLFAVLVQGLLAKRMVRPIAALGEVATQIAAGNLTRRVTEGVHLQDEVGELVRNFNQMAARLAESREEMERLYEGLEDKVRERTAALEKANLRLQELDRLKSHFLAAVSHELHSPLTSIKAYAEILLDAPSPDPTTRMRFLEIINLETDRLTRLINELLDLARIEAGAAVWRMEPCDLGATLRAAASALAGWAAEKDLTLEVAGSTPQTVRADPDRMQQVATNLIANAIRFCPSGGTIRAWLEETSWSGPGQRRPGRYVKVAVQDTGPGLPPEEAERVFEKFYQAGSEKPGAAGLGLAISREIVVHHGGEIWVESEPGRGSTFYFTAPLVESDAQEGSA